MSSNKVLATVIVCGKFHYNKYLSFLDKKGALNKFIYSYKIDYDFLIEKKKLNNYFLKEYLMYICRKVFKGVFFFKILKVLHSVWQFQISFVKPSGNIVHFLVHGNCFKAIEKYKKLGIPVIGEVVNVHPSTQEKLLKKEYDRHGINYKNGEVMFKEKIIYELSLCDYILVPSLFIKNSLIEYGINDDKIKTLPYALNELILKKAKSFITRDNRIKILCVAQITFRKGIIYLLRAIELLRNEGLNCSVTLIGQIDPEYEFIVESYFKKSYVYHFSHVENREIYTLLCQHDLFVIPSIEDGCSVVVLEALSVNLPVIVTSNNGASELVRNGFNGFVIEAFSEYEIFKAVINSIDYNFEFSANIPNWQDYTESLLDIYDNILKT